VDRLEVWRLRFANTISGDDLHETLRARLELLRMIEAFMPREGRRPRPRCSPDSTRAPLFPSRESDMGLDIRAYRGLQLAPAGPLSDDSLLYLREALAYTNKAFPGRAEIEIREVLDQWFGANCRYCKVKGDDRALYILRFDEDQSEWTLTMYASPEAQALAP
jgi:hypothetical protein